MYFSRILFVICVHHVVFILTASGKSRNTSTANVHNARTRLVVELFNVESIQSSVITLCINNSLVLLPLSSFVLRNRILNKRPIAQVFLVNACGFHSNSSVKHRSRTQSNAYRKTSSAVQELRWSHLVEVYACREERCPSAVISEHNDTELPADSEPTIDEQAQSATESPVKSIEQTPFVRLLLCSIILYIRTSITDRSTSHFGSGERWPT